MREVIERQPVCDDALSRRRKAELRGSVDGIMWTPWCFHCWLPCDVSFPPHPTWQTGKEKFVQARIVEGDEIIHTSPFIVWDEQWWGTP